MTAWTLFVQFLIDYIAYFIIAGILVVGIIVANIVCAVFARKKRKVKDDPAGNADKNGAVADAADK